MKKRYQVGIVILLAGAAGYYWLQSTTANQEPHAVAKAPEPLPVKASLQTPGASVAPVVTNSGTASPEASAPAVPQEDSLRGTEVDGNVTLDAFGQLHIDRNLRRLFDYYLQHIGEKPLHAIRDELLSWLKRNPKLTEPIRQQVMTLFDKYVDYLHAMRNVGSRDGPQETFKIIKSLRRQFFSEQIAQAFFGDEEAYDLLTADRLAIVNDKTLSDQQRAEKLKELEDRADDQQKAERQEMANVEAAMKQTQEFDEANVDAETRFKARSAMWGEEAARRLADLDTQQADWNNRANDFGRRYNELQGNAGLSEADRAAKLENLLSGFTEPERRRVMSLYEAGLLKK